MTRNWIADLLPASFAGIPFFVERDYASTGRRIATTEFAGSDEPFNEDLGRTARTIEIGGYCGGDTSDAQMLALEATCDSGIAATLVMPAQGPVLVRCRQIRRERQRDKMGRFGFHAHFVREGVSNALAPAEFLAQLAFDAGSALSAAAPGFLSGGISL
jgi:prophage DNA circulation protein